MSAIKFPILFCSPYQSCEPISLEPPFGLPATTFSDPCCKGIEALVVDLNQLLAPIMPFLTLVDCIVKLVDITVAIPTAIGPPPSITKLANLANQIADFLPCVGKLISLAPLPVNIVAFAKFLRGLMQMLIAILTCLKRVFTIFIDLNADILALSGTEDDYLKQMGICLSAQSDTMKDRLLKILNSLLNVFNLINLFLGIILDAMPPVKKLLEQEKLYPIKPAIPIQINPGQVIDLSWIDDVVVVLTAIETIANIFAGGS